MLTAKDLNDKLPYTFGNELEYLKELATKLPKNPHCLVLGAGPGIMSLALLESRPEMSILAVDNNREVLNTYNIHLLSAGRESRIWVGDTCDPNLVSSFDECEDEIFLDLLIIDADHSRFAVKRDFSCWFNRVAVGGYIFFHDYIDLEQNGTNGVRADILEIESLYANDIEFVDTPGISYVVRKIK